MTWDAMVACLDAKAAAAERVDYSGKQSLGQMSDAEVYAELFGQIVPPP